MNVWSTANAKTKIQFDKSESCSSRSSRTRITDSMAKRTTNGPSRAPQAPSISRPPKMVKSNKSVDIFNEPTFEKIGRSKLSTDPIMKSPTRIMMIAFQYACWSANPMVIGIQTMAVPRIGISEQSPVRTPKAYQRGIRRQRYANAAIKPWTRHVRPTPMRRPRPVSMKASLSRVMCFSERGLWRSDHCHSSMSFKRNV